MTQRAHASTMYHQAVETGTKIFATAPMIDWIA